MACVTEALGLMPLGSATAPAISADRLRIAEQTGKIAVELVKTGVKPHDVLSKQSFENAITVLQALGGSTNAIVHLLAIAGRVPNLALTLDDFDRIGRRTPLLVDIKPSGSNYMEDLNKAGGVPRLMRVVKHLLHLDAKTVSGRTLGEELDSFPPADFAQNIVKNVESPIFPFAAIAVLRGNLAPDGCVFKQSAAAPHLLKHSGPAVVFSSAQDMAARIDSDNLEVTADSVLIMQNIGPIGYPGMPEAGLIPIPKKLGLSGVKDKLRISDGRMSGTAEGAVVLHVAPESAVGGPLALVRTGDIVSIDVSQRRISMDVDDEELAKRGALWLKDNTRTAKSRGYRGLYECSVLQANEGADFSWLRADGTFPS